MPPRTPKTAPTSASFDEASALVATLARTETRREVVDALTAGGTAAPDMALAALRAAMRAHAFPAAAGPIVLRHAVESLDTRTRREGLHVLHGWDYTKQQRPPEIAPVLLVDYCARVGVQAERVPAALGAILEQYCVALAGLLLVRAWDDGDAGARVDQIDALLRGLAGPGASGHPLVTDSGSLLMLAVAYFHPEESAYAELLKRVWTLDQARLLRIAAPCAGVMASHLRWGLRFMYRQDLGAMRTDNEVDYPWSLLSLLTLVREYARPEARPSGSDDGGGGGGLVHENVVAGLLNGLAADPIAFTGKAPAFLAPWGDQHAELRDSLLEHRGTLLEEFAAMQPSAKAFSPLAFACNFVSNAAVAVTTLACMEPTSHPPLSALFERASGGSAAAAEQMARRLMDYASTPERLGAGGAPLITYDPYDGVHHYNAVVRALRAG